MIDNIDWAFRAWEELKYTRHYTFDDFLHHVLPYRIGHEPLTLWRGKAYERYAHLLDSTFTPLQVAVDMAMNEGMRYNIGMTKYPYLQSYEEMTASRWGACEEMAAYLALSLRAVGIPANIDFVTTWENRSSGHCWNVLKNTTGKFVEVGYDPNGENRVIYKPSKIYRKDYASVGGSDVTSEYAMPQSDLSFSLSSEHEGRIAALCTFNNREWVPVALAKCEGGNVLFASVGRGALWGTNELIGKKEFSIMILDEEFKVLGETKFPPFTYVPHVCFVREDGLYISTSHFMREDYSDDWLRFQRIDLVKNSM